MAASRAVEAPIEASSDELELFHDALERAPLGIIIYEPVGGGEDFLFIYTNPAVEAMKPFSRMLGRTYSQAWPEIAHIALPRFRDVLETGEPWIERQLPLEVEVSPGVLGTRYYTHQVVRVELEGRRYLLAFVSDVTHEQDLDRALVAAHESAERELDISDSLLGASVELARLEEVSQVAEVAAEILLRALGHSRVSVLLIDEQREESVIVTSLGASPLPEGTTLPFEAVSVPLETAVRAGSAMVFDFETLPAGSRGPADRFGATIALLAPIMQAGKVLGVISVDDPGGRKEFSERDVSLGEGIAAQAGVAIQNARRLEVQRERSARWQALAELAELTASALETSVVIERALSIAEDRLGAVSASVWTIDEQSKRLKGLAVRGFSQSFLDDFPEGIELTAPFPVAQAAHTGQPVLFERIDHTSELHGPVRAAYEKYGVPLRSLAALPLIAHGSVIGAMTLSWDTDVRFDESFVSFLVATAERFAASLQNAALFEERDMQTRYAEALNRINNVVHATLSPTEIVERIAEEMSEALHVDASLVQMRREGYRELVYSAGIPSDMIATKLTLQQTPLSDIVERTGEPVVIENLPTDPQAEGTILLQLELLPVIGLPLKVRSQVVGTLFVGRRDARPFSQREIDFARRVAFIASLAMDNASLYEAQQRVADRLQQALLSLPDAVAGLDFAHAYHSAAAAARVGGDFYDVFHADSGHVVIVVGDVAGKGLEAAVLTAVVRETIRAQSAEHVANPSSVLDITNDVLFKITPPESFVTVFLAILDCGDWSLTYSNAGHTPALLLRQGSIVNLPANGTILGAFPHPTLGQATAAFDEDVLLVLYTDGLIEARRDGELYGEERLGQTLLGIGDTDPSVVVDRLMADALHFGRGELSDDVAVLALRRASR